MAQHIDAYRAQIEAAGLPITDVDEDDGWASIGFKHEFATLRLSTPESEPRYCRVLLGFAVDQPFDGREAWALRCANENSEAIWVAKTTVGFREAGATLKFSCEFFSDADFTIKPDLRRYLEILSLAKNEFDKRFAACEEGAHD